MRLVESLTKFADHSSIHGLNYIAKSPSKTERIIWFILFTIALFYAAQQISKDFRGWQKNPTVAVVETLAEPIDKIQFPAVSICPQTFNSDRWGPTLKILDHLKPMHPSFGIYNSYQKIYHEFAAKVDNRTYKEAINLIKNWYPECKELDAWNPAKNVKYEKCTNQILTNSSTTIKQNIEDIKTYASDQNESLSIRNQFDEILAMIDLLTESKQPLEFAITHLKSVLTKSTKSSASFETSNSLERTREVIIRLKLIEWGYLGHYNFTSGSYFAHHYRILGPYFGDFAGNEWPHIPLHKDPISLADDFNQLLMNFTFDISNGSLKNVSLLDLPAFGSTIGTLKKGLKKQFIWPTKMNFALIKSNLETNKTTIMESYKTLTEDWRNYMDLLTNPHSSKHFTSEMKNNKFFNFSRYIDEDMKTFLISIAGTFPTALKYPLPFWKETAKEMFSNVEEDQFVQSKGIFDKLIIDCAFREDISLKKHPDVTGGCEGFYPTLTTNGMCYTFNGKSPLELWQSSKIINTFSTLFPSNPKNNKTFGGKKTVQGLQFWTNMKPYTNQPYGPSTLAYTIGVTEQINAIDQKMNVYKLIPGYHTIVHVVPKILETSSAFDNLNKETRKCKLPSESTGFQLFQEYSRKGCEIECAARRAVSFCQCLPWNYPNNFTTVPMCDMFGGFCFDQIMSNQLYYKECQTECLVDCQETSLSIWHDSVPIDTHVLCKGSYFESFFRQRFASIFAFESYQMLVQGKAVSDLKMALENGSLCVKYLESYVSLVTVESPEKSIIKSMREIAASFDDRLSMIGGTLAICLGKDQLIILFLRF